jgi:GT2 family glycosyltransferase/glycosyltransferase involved in cell wall biosynthesis
VIDIVVPVYNAPGDLAKCVESVLAHTRVPYTLVLIDDASPDAGVRAFFDSLAERALPHVTLLRNPANLGFTGTANRGMAHSRADVVLLNSDAIVTSGWLDAMLRCAASDPSIGTITPFSNNAEIASFPRLCGNHAWPEGADPEPVRAAIAEAAVPCYPDVPTGVGFCMYVRRALIDAIGTFDTAFGAGYGEENDFCMRALAAGWRNVLCDDAFVLHTGGRSFEGAKETLGVRNAALLLERHPHYLDLVRDFIARDPLAALREAALTAYDRRHGHGSGVLHVMHGGGGTETYVRSLAGATRGVLRHALATVRGDAWRIEELRSDGSTMHCEFGRRAEEPLEAFVRMLCAVYGATIVHVHHVSGSRDALLDALPRLRVPFVLTVHDLNFACPTITLHRPDGFFCGGVTDAAECGRCLRAQDGFESIDIERWRSRHAEVARAAAAVIAPSRWAAELFVRYFPGVTVDVVPHGARPRAPREGGAVQVVLMPDDDVPTVAVIGAIGPDKGARRIERLATLAAGRGAPVRFVVIGYLDRRSEAWQSDDARLTVHGRYDPRDLPTLLDHYRASFVLYPSAGPESFAFTLSEAWAAGRPVLVPPIGALAERVGDHGAGWIMREDEWRDESLMLDRVVSLVAPRSRDELATAAMRATAMPIPTLEAMVARTLEVYARAVSRAPADPPPTIEPLRVAEAFGYRRWRPDVASVLAPRREPPAHASAQRSSWLQRLRGRLGTTRTLSGSRE